MNTANASITEIEEYFGLEFETYIGYTDDHLDLLTKEEFANMEDALNSTCIEGIVFRNVIMDDNTEILGQD